MASSSGFHRFRVRFVMMTGCARSLLATSRVCMALLAAHLFGHGPMMTNAPLPPVPDVSAQCPDHRAPALGDDPNLSWTSAEKTISRPRSTSGGIRCIAVHVPHVGSVSCTPGFRDRALCPLASRRCYENRRVRAGCCRYCFDLNAEAQRAAEAQRV